MSHRTISSTYHTFEVFMNQESFLILSSRRKLMEKKKLRQEETQQSGILADRNAATGEANTLAAKDAGVDEETERLLREYLQQTEKLDEARNADRGRQSEALKAKLAAKYALTCCVCALFIIRNYLIDNNLAAKSSLFLLSRVVLFENRSEF